MSVQSFSADRLFLENLKNVKIVQGQANEIQVEVIGDKKRSVSVFQEGQIVKVSGRKNNTLTSTGGGGITVGGSVNNSVFITGNDNTINSISQTSQINNQSQTEEVGIVVKVPPGIHLQIENASVNCATELGSVGINNSAYEVILGTVTSSIGVQLSNQARVKCTSKGASLDLTLSGNSKFVCIKSFFSNVFVVTTNVASATIEGKVAGDYDSHSSSPSTVSYSGKIEGEVNINTTSPK